MLRTKWLQFAAVMCCFMAACLPSAQALTFDSTYYSVVRERDVARAQLETLQQSNPDIQKVLEDERKAIASTREELRTEQRASAKWQGIVLWGIPLCALVSVLAGTAIGSMARRTHVKQQIANSPPTLDRRARDEPGRE
ncbi:MAG: hypothetical protein FWD61_14425 [Phycisphaerales bacterium]|nr:hypothetical protein [Phycisphaerales bacterium]